MDSSSFISGLLGAGIGGSLVTLYFGHLSTNARDQRKESLLARQKQRDASAAVVEILSEWTRTTYTGEAPTGEDKWRLQTTYWRNILLLDKELLVLLQSRLANSPESVDTNELIVQARRILLELDAPDITAKELNVWK